MFCRHCPDRQDVFNVSEVEAAQSRLELVKDFRMHAHVSRQNQGYDVLWGKKREREEARRKRRGQMRASRKSMLGKKQQNKMLEKSLRNKY